MTGDDCLSFDTDTTIIVVQEKLPAIAAADVPGDGGPLVWWRRQCRVHGWKKAATMLLHFTPFKVAASSAPVERVQY